MRPTGAPASFRHTKTRLAPAGAPRPAGPLQLPSGGLGGKAPLRAGPVVGGRAFLPFPAGCREHRGGGAWARPKSGPAPSGPTCRPTKRPPRAVNPLRVPRHASHSEAGGPLQLYFRGFGGKAPWGRFGCWSLELSLAFRAGAAILAAARAGIDSLQDRTLPKTTTPLHTREPASGSRHPPRSDGQRWRCSPRGSWVCRRQPDLAAATGPAIQRGEDGAARSGETPRRPDALRWRALAFRRELRGLALRRAGAVSARTPLPPPPAGFRAWRGSVATEAALAVVPSV
jgi:hypothetical protein